MGSMKIEASPGKGTNVDLHYLNYEVNLYTLISKRECITLTKITRYSAYWGCFVQSNLFASGPVWSYYIIPREAYCKQYNTFLLFLDDINLQF
jgi:hypothetical protein